MISFPPCKINLGLQIRHKRADGYHALSTIFYPVPFTDVLELIRSSDNSQPVHFFASGLPIAGDPVQNLCVRAVMLMRTRFPDLPSVEIRLHKVIPTGAGLGGGSSDGAHTLLLLNQLFSLGLSQEELAAMALQLGSDCPFFIYEKPTLAHGRGEIFEPISLDLKGYQLVLIHPGIHVSTAEAFHSLNRPKNEDWPLLPWQDVVARPVATWKDNLINDFEAPVFAVHPRIAQLKAMLYQMGAVYASMSGSGSAVFGLFEPETPISVEADPGHRVFQCRLAV